jgi:hypothetical protein
VGMAFTLPAWENELTLDSVVARNEVSMAVFYVGEKKLWGRNIGLPQKTALCLVMQCVFLYPSLRLLFERFARALPENFPGSILQHGKAPVVRGSAGALLSVAVSAVRPKRHVHADAPRASTGGRNDRVAKGPRAASGSPSSAG